MNVLVVIHRHSKRELRLISTCQQINFVCLYFCGVAIFILCSRLPDFLFAVCVYSEQQSQILHLCCASIIALFIWKFSLFYGGRIASVFSCRVTEKHTCTCSLMYFISSIYFYLFYLFVLNLFLCVLDIGYLRAYVKSSSRLLVSFVT
jgi:hypothetical protein